MEPAMQGAKRTRGQMDDKDAECCICFNAFEASGPRTKVCSFQCSGGERHATCRACDKTMYSRHTDKCPTCRAPRDVATSDAMHGGRSAPPPPEDAPVLLPGGWGGFGAGRMFFAVDSSGFDGVGAGDLGHGMVQGFARASAARHSRYLVPTAMPSDAFVFDAEDDTEADNVALVEDFISNAGGGTAFDQPGDDAVASAIIEEAVRHINADSGIQGALSALRNVAGVNLAGFTRLVSNRAGRPAVRRSERARSQPGPDTPVVHVE